MHQDVNQLPVVRGDIPVGIVARHDRLRVMLSKSAALQLRLNNTGICSSKIQQIPDFRSKPHAVRLV
jgi:hypothetical protein